MLAVSGQLSADPSAGIDGNEQADIDFDENTRLTADRC